MKAAAIYQTGPREVIQFTDMPIPEPKPHELLLRVGAVAVNPIDTYIRGGVIPMPIQFPYIVGCDFAGTIERSGDEVSAFTVGERVWGSNQGLFGRQGTFAEYITVDPQWCYPTPTDMSDAEAAAGALVGITAHLGLFLHAGLKGGELVFVNGGTGGVGSAVVQLARSVGAKVVTTAGTEEKRDRERASPQRARESEKRDDDDDPPPYAPPGRRGKMMLCGQHGLDEEERPRRQYGRREDPQHLDG